MNVYNNRQLLFIVLTIVRPINECWNLSPLTCFITIECLIANELRNDEFICAQTTYFAEGPANDRLIFLQVRVVYIRWIDRGVTKMECISYHFHEYLKEL